MVNIGEIITLTEKEFNLLLDVKAQAREWDKKELAGNISIDEKIVMLIDMMLNKHCEE
tara:strand:- start:825 stop:998 length:174 start_codon:yes stop_codon:yes gene_type:complete